MQDYRKLDVWTKAHELALDLHRTVLRTGAAAEVECAADLRRAALDVPATIVRGCEAETAEDFARAMREASTAVDALAYRLFFARDAGVLGGVPYAKLEARTQQLRAMLGGLNRTVRIKMGAGGRAPADRAPAGPAVTEDHSTSPSAAVRSAVARAMRTVRDADSSLRESRR